MISKILVSVIVASICGTLSMIPIAFLMTLYDIDADPVTILWWVIIIAFVGSMATDHDKIRKEK